MKLNEENIVTQLLCSVQQYGVVRTAENTRRQPWIQNIKAH